MSKYIIRKIKEEDIKKVLEIYTPYILNTTVTFEYNVPSLKEFTDRVNNIIATHPYLVCECDGLVIGYAYASKYHSRTAFNWDCELSIYIDNKHHSKGIGKRLYKALIDYVTKLNYYNAYGVISIPNESSESLHKYFGFENVGVHKNVGYKFDKWLDLGYYIKKLREYDKPNDFPKNHNDVIFEEIKW